MYRQLNYKWHDYDIRYWIFTKVKAKHFHTYTIKCFLTDNPTCENAKNTEFKPFSPITIKTIIYVFLIWSMEYFSFKMVVLVINYNHENYESRRPHLYPSFFHISGSKHGGPPHVQDNNAFILSINNMHTALTGFAMH